MTRNDPDPDAPAVEPGIEPEDPPAAPDPTGQILVAVPYGTVFEHGIDGVPALTFTPQAVPAESLTALREVATACGVKLTEEPS